MDRGAWQAIVHGVTRVGRDLVTKPLPVVKNLPSNAGDGGLIPDQGVKISCHGATKPSSRNCTQLWLCHTNYVLTM